MTSSADVLRILRALRRRMHVALFLERLAVAALVVSAVLVVIAAINCLPFNPVTPDRRTSPLPEPFLRVGALMTCVIAFFGTILRSRSLAEMAVLLDARGQTRDRFVSALAFAKTKAVAKPMHELAERECVAFLTHTDFRPLVPVRLPAVGAWLVVPFVALALLQWEFMLVEDRRQTDAAVAQARVADTVQTIEQLAKQAERANEQTKNDDLKKLAEELQHSATRLRAETHGAEAQKAALRELSALEAMMKEMQRQPSLPEEMKELAKALGSVPGLEDVLKALEQNKLAEAAHALDEAEKKTGEKSAALTDEQVQQALQQATERLAQQRQLSEGLQRLADQARQQDGYKGMTSQAMQHLRAMLQQMQKNGGDSQSGGNPQQRMTLQQLIAALQNMKFNDGQSLPPQGSPGQQPPDGPQIAMQSPGLQNSEGPQQPGVAQDPSGRPGSEHDFGTTDTPFGKKNDPTDKGAETALKGQLADGESLSTMLPAASDTAHATRRYKELYNAMAPAAENAVEQENIPLGSRFFIKRYFESIRPKE